MTKLYLPRRLRRTKLSRWLFVFVSVSVQADFQPRSSESDARAIGLLQVCFGHGFRENTQQIRRVIYDSGQNQRSSANRELAQRCNVRFAVAALVSRRGGAGASRGRG